MCNNIKNFLWGAAGSPLNRILLANYSDKVSEPRGRYEGTNLPNPRWMSQRNHPDNDNPDTRFTHMVMQFGQFLDHDITISPNDERIDCCGKKNNDARCFIISIPPRDRFYSWVNFTASCINFVRSTPVCQKIVREQYNGVTSFVDASNVYGSSIGQLSFIRSYKDGKLEQNKNTNQLPTREQLNLRPDLTLLRPQKQMDFVAGDNRVNEHPFLSAMHVIFLREHNRIARELKKHLRNELKNDETIFQESKRLVSAEMQNIVYGEFLPTVLGADIMKKYKLLAEEESLYDPDTKPDIINSFTTAAFRFGHSMINSMFMLISGKNKENSASFWRLREIFDGHNVEGQRLPIEEMIEGLVSQMPQTTDAFFSTEITNHLFQKNERQENFGLDLLAINIQRGRDHGIPSYNEFRKFCKLSSLTSWNKKPRELNQDYWNSLKDVYGSVNDIDLMIGGIAENNVKGGAVGATFACIIGEQFKRIKYGDRYFYTHIADKYDSMGLGYISKKNILNRTLGDILCENTELDILQKWVTLQPDLEYNPQEPCLSRPLMDFQAIAEEIESELLHKTKLRKQQSKILRSGKYVNKLESGLLNVICQKSGIC